MEQNPPPKLNNNLLSTQQATGSQAPPKIDFVDYISKAREANPYDFSPLPHLGELGRQEFSGNISEVVIPSLDSFSKKYPEGSDPNIIQSDYDGIKKMYDVYQKNKFLIPEKASNATHWTNLYGPGGEIDLSEYVTRSASWTGIGQYRTRGIDGTFSNGEEIWGDEERAFSSGNYLGKDGEILPLGQSGLGNPISKNTGPNYRPSGRDIEGNELSIDYLNDPNYGRIPFYRERGDDERLTETNIPVGINVERGSNSWFQDFFGNISSGWPSEMVFGGLKFAMDASSVVQFHKDPFSTASVRDGLFSMVENKKISPEAADILLRGMNKDQIIGLAEIGDPYAAEALDAMSRYDAIEDAIYNQGTYDRVSDWLGAKAFSLDYVPSRETREHGFTGGEDGFNLADFSSNLGEGISFLIPQLGAARIGSRIAASAGMWNKIAGAFTIAGENLIGRIGAGTLAAQMGGITELEAIRNGIDAEMAATIAMASLPITYGTERLLGTNWMAKWYGNTYYKEITQKEISDAIRSVAKEYGLDLKNLTKEEAKSLGRKVGEKVNKSLFGLGGKFSLKSGMEAVSSGSARALKGFPYGLNAANRFVGGLPGMASVGITEAAQETLEDVGYSFIERMHDKFLSKRGSYQGKGQYGTELFSNDWWEKIGQSFFGGLFVGGVMGHGVKGKKEITESIIGLIASGDSSKAKEIVDQMQKDGLFGFSHLSSDGSVLTQEDIASGKKSMDVEMAEQLKRNIDLIDEIVKISGLKDVVSAENIQKLLGENKMSDFRLMKEGIGILMDKKRSEELVAKMNTEMQSATEEDKKSLSLKISSEMNKIDYLKERYSDIVNGNYARGVGLYMYSSRIGIDPSATQSAKNLHKRINERYEREQKDFNKMLSETQEKRSENSQKIKDLISEINGISQNISNPQQIYEKIVSLSKGATTGSFDEESVTNLKKSIKDFESNLVKGMVDSGVDESEAQMEIGQSEEYGNLVSESSDFGATGSMMSAVAKPPDIGKIIKEEFTVNAYDGNSTVNIMDEMSMMFNLIKQGQVSSTLLHRATFYDQVIDTKEIMLNASINGLNNIDPKYSFEYAHTDTGIQQDASKTKIDSGIEKQIRSEIEKMRKFAADLKAEILKNSDIRQERSNKFLIDYIIINMNIINEIFESNKSGSPSIGVSEKYEKVSSELASMTSDIISGKQLVQAKYDNINKLFGELSGELHVWMRSSDPNKIANNAIRYIAEKHLINRFNRYESALEASYGYGTSQDPSGNTVSNTMADAAHVLATKINSGIKLSSKEANARYHALYAKMSIDYINNVLRFDHRQIRKDLSEIDPGVTMNYQQEQVLSQLVGFLRSDVNIINGSYKNLLTYEEDDSQSYSASLNGDLPFYNNAIHISGNAGSGKTSLIISNALKSLSKFSGKKIKTGIVAPSVFNINELLKSLNDQGTSSTYVDGRTALIGEINRVIDDGIDVLIVDESHNIGSEEDIKEILNKANEKNIKVVFMGDNRQMPSLKNQPAMTARSFLVHPAFYLMERTQPMYEIYRSGNAEVSTLQDEIGNYIEKPKGDKFPHFSPEREYKFNATLGVEIINNQPIERLFAEIQSGGDAIGIAPGDIERDFFVQKLISMGIGEADANKRVKTLSPDKSMSSSVSILGGKHPTVVVLSTPDSIKDFRLHARYLLTASSRAENKVIMYGDPAMSIKSDDIVSLNMSKNHIRYYEWISSMRLTDPPPAESPSAKIETKVTVRHSFDVGYRYEKANGEMYEIVSKHPNGTYDVRLIDPESSSLVGETLNESESEIKLNKKFSRGDKIMGPINVSEEWDKYNNTDVQNMTMLDQSSVFDSNEAIKNEILNSKYADFIRNGFNNLSSEEKANVLRDNFANNIEDHILNQARYYVRYSIMNMIPNGAPLNIEFHAERKYLGGKTYKKNLEIHVDPEMIAPRLPGILSSIGISPKNAIEVSRISKELGLTHIGNIRDVYGMNSNRMAIGARDYFKNLIENRPVGLVSVGTVTMQAPETTDAYDSAVVPPYNDPTNQRIPFVDFINRISAMGQVIDSTSIKQGNDNSYRVTIRRSSVSPGKTVKGSTIKVFPKNILSDTAIAESYINNLISDAKSMKKTILDGYNPLGEMFRSSFYRFIIFNRKNIKDNILRDSKLGNIFDRHLYEETKDGKLVAYRGKGRSESLQGKDAHEVQSIIDMLIEIKKSLGSLVGKESLYAHLPREINTKSDKRYMSLIEVDRNYSKHTVTWVKIPKLNLEKSQNTSDSFSEPKINTHAFTQIDNIKDDSKAGVISKKEEKEYEKGDYQKVIQLVKDTVAGKEVNTPENLQLLTNYPKLYNKIMDIERRRQEDLETTKNIGEDKLKEGRENTKKIVESLKQRYPATSVQGIIIRILEKLIDFNKYSTIIDSDYLSGRNASGQATWFGMIISQETLDGILEGKEFEVHTFIHEFIHGFTTSKISDYNIEKQGLIPGFKSKLTAKEKNAIEQLQRIFEKVKRDNPKSKEYGFTNLDEFIAEAFSNSRFQYTLKNTKAEGKKSNLFSEFINAIGDLLFEQLERWAKRFNKEVPDRNTITGILEDVLAWTEELIDENNKLAYIATNGEINAKYDAELAALEGGRIDNLLINNEKIAEIENNFEIVVDLLKSQNRLEVKC